MSDVTVRGLLVGHGATPILRGIDLEVASGSVVAVLGPSGCGKTTLLLAIAGLLALSGGEIRIGDRVLSDSRRTVPSEKRGVGWVPQEASLFPHLSVAENIGFGLPRGRNAAARRSRVLELTHLVGLDGFDDRAPSQLSGGQAQRVALARALAPRPNVLLLDEPFAALDTQLRASLRREVVDLLRDQRTTSILVTHDQEEALSLADQVAIMRDGVIEQSGSPAEIYERPISPWVARFVGDTVELPGTWSQGRVASALGPVQAEAIGFEPVEGEQVLLMLRPEWVVLRSDVISRAAASADARVTGLSYAGHDVMVTCELDSGTVIRARLNALDVPALGDRLRLAVRRPGYAYPLPRG